MSLIKLQEVIGAKPDGSFGEETIKKAAKFYKLTPLEAIHFFAQCSHETGGFKAFSENLNYSSTGLRVTFSKYFTPELAVKYQRNPVKIANRVYANRMGNGSEASGDGWKYRGRGAIQLTGKANYIAFAKFVNRPDIITNPDIILQSYAFYSAYFFFSNNKLFKICNEGLSVATITKLTKKINGGTKGLKGRISKTLQYAKYFDL